MKDLCCVTTRILVLSMGIISAIAINGMRIRVLAVLHPSMNTTAQSEDEINDKNWQNNPKIVAIRKIVNSANTEVRKGVFKTEHRICEEGWFRYFGPPVEDLKELVKMGPKEFLRKPYKDAKR